MVASVIRAICAHLFALTKSKIPQSHIVVRLRRHYNGRMKKVCSVDGCDGSVRYRGMCESHHWRFKTHGPDFDRSPVRRRVERGPICTVQGCGLPNKSMGLCVGHYTRRQRDGADFDRSPVVQRLESGEEIIARALAEATPDKCWEWPLSKNPDGYGWFSVDTKTVQVHREVCRRAHGEPPSPEHFSCHSCDNPPCINRHHLRWDTPQGNIDDRQQRARHMHGSSHYKAKLDENKVREIRRRLDEGEDEHALAEEYGVTHGSIWFIHKGRTWKHVA